MLDWDLLAPERPRPLKRREYDRLVAGGAFEDERVELLRGVLVAMSPSEPPHAATIQRLTHLLLSAVGGRAAVRVQLPIIAADESEPEPDLAVVPPGDYDEAHPERALLVIEVADSTLGKDRRIKAPLYAASGFGEYWIVNLVEKVVEVFRGPAASGYGRVARVERGGELRPEAFPDVAIAVSDFLR